jgi:ribonuclease E
LRGLFGWRQTARDGVEYILMPTKRMLVDATHPEETRVVVTSGNRLEEFDFEAASRRQLRGNIYLAKVTRVEPSLQAAFVDYGGNRHGFLAFSEIHPDYYQIPVADREALKAAEVDEQEEEAVEEMAADEPGAQSAPAAEADEEEAADGGTNVQETAEADQSVDNVGGDDAIEEAQSRKRNLFRRYKIQEVIKRRQVMLVQVVKEERGNKGAALTTYLSLAGRYSVLMPNTARGGGISRKITNALDRKRLKEIATDLEVPDGMGVILRTAGAARTKAEVKRDFEYLMRLWENVRTLTLESQAPNLVYEEGSLIKRTIRDLYSKDIDEVLVSGEAAYREAKDFMKMIMPSHAKNVQQYKEDQPIFSKFSVESQLDAMFSPQVTLPSGGYIVINPTEALVSIDVNSGRSTREHNIEDTAYQTNLEAADEVARQLRLRDLAGLVVIDFIDMMERRSIRNVERRLKDALKNDRARIQVGRISHFGLMEMSRQRIRFGVLESSTHVCPICSGAGIVRSVESLALMVMRAIEDHVLKKNGQALNVRVPTDVALYILNAKRVTLMDLEAKYDIGITITADAKLQGNHFNIERAESRLPGADVPRPVHIKVDSAEMRDYDEEEEAEIVSADDEEETPESAESPERSSRRRRRRGRGRGRGEGDVGAETRPAVETEARADAESEADESDDADEVSAETAEARAPGEEEGPRKRRRRGRRGGRRNRKTMPDVVEGEFEAQEAIEGWHRPPLAEHVAVAVNDFDDAVVPIPDNDFDTPVRTPNRKAETISTEAASEAAETAGEPAAEAVDTADAEPKRKPRRRSRKAEPEATPPATAEAAPAPSVGEEASAPRPRRARKPKTAAAPDAVTEATPAPESENTPDSTADASSDGEAPTETPEDAKPPRPGKALPEKDIVVTSSDAKEVPSEDDGKPKKTGWWQRGFFG